MAAPARQAPSRVGRLAVLDFTVFQARKKITLNARDWSPGVTGRFQLKKGVQITRDREMVAYLSRKYRGVVDVQPQPMHIKDSLPLEAWDQLRRHPGKALFLSPTRAIGDNVMLICALSALREANPGLSVTVAFVGDAFPLYAAAPALAVHPYFLGEADIGAFDVLVDVDRISAWDAIIFEPFDIEKALLERFQVPPAASFPGRGRAFQGSGRPLIRMFPLASSPLRTVPVEMARRLAEAAAAVADVEIVLAKGQLGSERYRGLLAEGLPPGITVTPGCRDLKELARKVETADFGIFADSGPSHIAKLFDTPGVTIFTSAHSAPLIGRFENLLPWQTPYKGTRCTAPCGLATYLRTPSGAGGCWETLGGVRQDYVKTRELWNPEEYLALMFDRPVPCVRRLGEGPHDLVETVVQEIARRCAR